MSVFDGEMFFETVYRTVYKKHKKLKSPRRKPVDDDCLIAGFGRESLKPKPEPQKNHDLLCPLQREFYKDLVQRLDGPRSRLKKLYFEKDVDPIPIEHVLQDRGRSEYLVKYSSRELPFMSVNMAQRARALQTLHLPDDIAIPATTHTSDYRPPTRDKFQPPKLQSMRPVYDPTLKEELRRILRTRTGESTYASSVGHLGRVVLQQNPYGPAREEPRYGKWRNPHQYSYQL